MDELIKVGRNEALSRATLVLPKYDELTDQRVVKEMQSVFKGFDFDPTENCEHKFKTVEQIEAYAAEASRELAQADNAFKMAAVQNNGAIAAKRWHFGWVINQCLKSSKYGAGLAEKLAAAADISLSYLYQYRAVGDNLSIRDAYILGMYGAGWGNIKAIGAISDADTRATVIQFFVQSISDYNNPVAIEQAKVALEQVLQSLKRAPELPPDTSNPKQLDAMINFDQEAPEFVEAQKQIAKLATACRNRKVPSHRKVCRTRK